MTRSIASDGRWPIAQEDGSHDVAEGRAQGGGGRRALRATLGLLGDGAMLLLVVWAFPIVLLLLASPVALLVKVLLEIAGVS